MLIPRKLVQSAKECVIFRAFHLFEESCIKSNSAFIMVTHLSNNYDPIFEDSQDLMTTKNGLNDSIIKSDILNNWNMLSHVGETTSPPSLFRDFKLHCM